MAVEGLTRGMQKVNREKDLTTTRDNAKPNPLMTPPPVSQTETPREGGLSLLDLLNHPPAAPPPVTKLDGAQVVDVSHVTPA